MTLPAQVDSFVILVASSEELANIDMVPREPQVVNLAFRASSYWPGH